MHRAELSNRDSEQPACEISFACKRLGAVPMHGKSYDVGAENDEEAKNLFESFAASYERE